MRRSADRLHRLAEPIAGMSATGARIVTLDAVRGLAVMGILLPNIVDFAMPGYTYVDPHFYGGATGANIWVWRIVYVLFDGKMRGLFTMLFGASIWLIADRATAAGQSAWRIHYARMVTLLLFGLVHAYLIWSGDILVSYAWCGAIVFLARRWRASALWYAGITLLIFKLAFGAANYTDARSFEAAAAAPGAGPALRAEWSAFARKLAPPAAEIPKEIATHRGPYADALPARTADAWSMETIADVQAIPDTIALMLIGMALFRSGFFSGAWSRRTYRWIMIAGFGICVPLYLPIVLWIEATHFSPITLMLTEALHLTLLRPFVSLAWASLVILFVQSGALAPLAKRLGAVGRTAFSNYLGTSILCTLLFDGYGLGWYASLQRWQCYPVVFAIWGLMLLWSKLWLDRFAYGPFEWAWRSLARLRPAPFLRRIPIAT
jgi:uncharacterized protein